MKRNSVPAGSESPPRPERQFKDSWRPEDKAMESAEEEALEPRYPEAIANQRAERHRNTPPLRGFEKPASNEAS